MAIITIDKWIADWETVTNINRINDTQPTFESTEKAVRGEIHETPFNEYYDCNKIWRVSNQLK